MRPLQAEADDRDRAVVSHAIDRPERVVGIPRLRQHEEAGAALDQLAEAGSDQRQGLDEDDAEPWRRVQLGGAHRSAHPIRMSPSSEARASAWTRLRAPSFR